MDEAIHDSEFKIAQRIGSNETLHPKKTRENIPQARRKANKFSSY